MSMMIDSMVNMVQHSRPESRIDSNSSTKGISSNSLLKARESGVRCDQATPSLFSNLKMS
jgi:hypothetical protein